MTRKEYQLIADAIRLATEQLSYVVGSPGTTENAQHLQGIVRAAVAIANALRNDNPQFDREKFLAACGIDR